MAKIKKGQITKGYIAYADMGPMELALNPDTGDDVLYFSNVATVFTARPQVRKAIETTIDNRPTFEQEFGKLQIKRLISR